MKNFKVEITIPPENMKQLGKDIIRNIYSLYAKNKKIL
jgi:hypothetical protein